MSIQSNNDKTNAFIFHKTYIWIIKLVIFKFQTISIYAYL